MEMFLVFLLLNAVEYSRCERFNIVPSPDSPCPGEFTGEPCLTLEQYVANPSLSSNITFEIHPGNHRLDSQLTVRNINTFMMRANASAVVTCNQQLREAFYFNQLQQIHVSGVTFVGCRMYLQSITNAIFERSSFVNRSRCCQDGAALYVQYSSVMIRQCIISNNKRSYDEGIIYGYQSNFIIEETTFSHNYACCSSNGGAIYAVYGNIAILNSNFSDNSAGSSSNSHGGATYISDGTLTVIGTFFSNNRAGHNGHGGAIYFAGSNITVTNSSFINNTASTGGGGAIHSVRRYTNISLISNLFSHNTAAYCGVITVAEFYHHHVDIIGNTFTYNRAVQQISGNNGGGVICIRNASMLVSDNNFSHNSAAGDGGVMQVDESDVTIERSIFRNNTAVGNGGVLHTYFYPTRYTIIDSSFTNNGAGGDGGVMYVGRSGGHVTINQSTFSFNNAANRGGVIAVVGNTLEIYGANVLENAANLGDVISACNSQVTVSNPVFLASQDPIYSFCTLYDSSNTTISRTTEQTTPTAGITTDTTTKASTTTEHDALTTTTLLPTNDVTSTEEITITVEELAKTTTQVEDEETTTTEGDTIATTTEDIGIATTTTSQQGRVTTTMATGIEETTTVATTEDMTTTVAQPSQGTTRTDEDNFMSSTYESTTATEKIISNGATPLITTPYSSTKIEPIDSTNALPTTTGSIINGEDRDTADFNLHYIVPGYVAIGACAVLFVLVIFIGLLVVIKMFRGKSKSKNVNLSAYDYPAIKNQYTLPDVHVVHLTN